MTMQSSLRRLVLLVVILLGGGRLGLLAACSGEERSAGPAMGAALRDRFPEQAAEVLDAGEGFDSTAEGFVARAPAGAGVFRPAGEAFEVVLSLTGEGGLVFRGRGGFAPRVREVGAAGAGALVGRAVMYSRSGGRSYWTTIAGGAEEWLELEAESVTRNEPVAAWDVEGASLRQRGEAVEVLDESGNARIRVTAPRAYAVGGRPIAARVSAQGARIELWVEAEGESVLVDPAWVSAADMNAFRYHHTSTLLPNGKVLVAGGRDINGSALASAELYDFATGTWMPVVPDMSVARAGHTATLLRNGKVLIAGGKEGVDHPLTPALASAVLYDPTTGATGGWTPVTIDMTVARSGHTATLLVGGGVLMTAGDAGGTAERYYAGPNPWTLEAPATPLPPISTATLLLNGDVLVAGETNVQIYDQVTHTWKLAASMSVARSYHTATALSNGRVLVAGGLDTSNKPISSAEIYDPALDAWHPAGVLNVGRYNHAATRLPNGKILVEGGKDNTADLTSAELYDPVTGAWRAVTPMLRYRERHTATMLSSGDVLIVGGRNVSYDSGDTAELYSPSNGIWAPTAPMSTTRYAHTVTLLPSGKVLVVGGLTRVLTAWVPINTAELYDPALESWAPVAPMSVARSGHTATSLTDGRILVAGGAETSDGQAQASAELFDPATGKWMSIDPMKFARAGHTATLLVGAPLDGSVLVAGGTEQGNGQAQDSAELFDPATMKWTPIDPMSVARSGHTATRLVGGQVLVAGGDGGATFELFDPASRNWTATASSMKVSGRRGHTATLLPNGEVLVVGGHGSDEKALQSAERFDPLSQTWKETPPPPPPGDPSKFFLCRHAAALLPDGDVLVAGGCGGGQLYPDYYGDFRALLYNPTSDTWTFTEDMNYRRVTHSATLLPDGKVLVAGGDYVATAELYDPGGRWASAKAMSQGRTNHTATRLDDGKVLVAGGSNSGGYLDSSELFGPDPMTSIWTQTTSNNMTTHMSTARGNHTATLLVDGPLGGQVLVAGGSGSAGYVISAELFDPATQTWMTTGDMSVSRGYHAATQLLSGKVLVVGGWGATGELASAELFDPMSGSFTTIAVPLTTPRYGHTATLIPENGKVLVVGGLSGLAKAELYDPSNGTWAIAGAAGQPRVFHTATLLKKGDRTLVLVAGGVNNNGPLAEALLFDPDTTTWALTAPMLHARGHHVATLLKNGHVLVAGGAGPQGALDSAEVYDPDKEAWSPIRSLTVSRSAPAAALLQDGGALQDDIVLVVGGAGSDGFALETAELFRASKQGVLCDHSADCLSGFCVDAVCCDTPCDAGPCDGCSALTGAATPGTCALFTGPSCDDGEACTQKDTCKDGVCTGENPVVCPDYGPCHKQSTCLKGLCSEPAIDDNLACSDKNACTQEDSCQGGECKGGPPVICDKPPSDPGCHEPGICDMATGVCSYAKRLDGTPCDDGDMCTVADTCKAGLCEPGSSVVCPAPDVDGCHIQATCDPKTGECNNSIKSDGATCDDHIACTDDDRCQGGVCVGKDTNCPCPECEPYVCFGAAKACKTPCASVADCASGYVCNLQGNCVSAKDLVATVDDTGCALRAPGRAGGSAWPVAALALLALGASSRRRAR